MTDPLQLEALRKAHEEYNSTRSSEAANRFREAHFAIYDSLLGDVLASFFRGERIFLEVVIQLLEEDPFYFRSGYLKERIAHRLLKTPLTDWQKKRLSFVCLNLVDKPARREVRRFSQLAALVADEVLVTELEKRIESESPYVRKRASWMLENIRLHGPDEFRNSEPGPGPHL